MRYDVDIRLQGNVPREAIRILDVAIVQAGLSSDYPTIVHTRGAVEIAAIAGTVSLIILNGVKLAKLFGIEERFKAYQRVMGEHRAQQAIAKKQQEEMSKQIRDCFVTEAVSTIILRGDIGIVIIIYVPPEKFSNGMNCNDFGGLPIRGSTKDEVASQLAAFVFHTPALLDLIDNEILPEPILGGIYLELLEDGALKVTWMFQKEMKKQTRIIRPDDSI